MLAVTMPVLCRPMTLLWYEILCGTDGVISQEPQHLTSRANEILTAIVHGLRKDEQNQHVKLAAANAMLNTIEFSKANFDREVKTEVQNKLEC